MWNPIQLLRVLLPMLRIRLLDTELTWNTSENLPLWLGSRPQIPQFSVYLTFDRQDSCNLSEISLIIFTVLWSTAPSPFIQHKFFLGSPAVSRVSCSWCNGYRRMKWIQWPQFKSWTNLLAFYKVSFPVVQFELKIRKHKFSN